MILKSCWVILGSCWERFGVIWGSFWGHVGIMLGSFWGQVGVILGSFWTHHGVMLGHFGVNLESVWPPHMSGYRHLIEVIWANNNLNGPAPQNLEVAE